MRKHRLVDVSLTAGFIFFATSAYAQQQNVEAATMSEAVTPASDEDIVTEAFLARKNAEQASKGRRLGALRGSGEQGQIIGLIKAASIALPDPELVKDQRLKSRISDVYVVDVAQYLLSLGFTTGQVRSDKSGAILSAASEVVRGTASMNAFALLSDVVAQAELVSFESSRLGDGLNSGPIYLLDPARAYSPQSS